MARKQFPLYNMDGHIHISARTSHKKDQLYQYPSVLCYYFIALIRGGGGGCQPNIVALQVNTFENKRNLDIAPRRTHNLNLGSGSLTD